ncbi:MAG: alpha/beta fold hydrolase [Bacteroidota bacterium]
MKKLRKILGRLFLFGFLAFNVIACNHAYRFTHFTATEGQRIKPEQLSFAQKLKVLFLGVENPKPVNQQIPDSPFQTIAIQSQELLEAWLIKQADHKGLILLFHGYAGSKAGMLNYGKMFNQWGYSTLLVDFQGCGGSTGYQTTIGHEEGKDVRAVFDYARQQFPDDPIILFGTSMGAASIMRAYAEAEIPADKVILECPFGRMRQTVIQRFKAMKVPSFPFVDCLMLYGSIINGFNTYSHNPQDYARSLKVPTLLLQGSLDQRVTKEETKAIFANLPAEKKLVWLPRSGHQNYLLNSQENWETAVTEFLGEEN